jgi:hypothetical protein
MILSSVPRCGSELRRVGKAKVSPAELPEPSSRNFGACGKFPGYFRLKLSAGSQSKGL